MMKIASLIIHGRQAWLLGIYLLLRVTFRSQKNLDDYLRDNNVVAIADIDTRRLTRILREKGSLSGCIVAAEEADQIDESSALAQAQGFAGLKGLDLAKEVTTDKHYEWNFFYLEARCWARAVRCK